MSNVPPFLSGTVPGLMDPSQPTRLLRTPSSSIFFAAFDPLAAHASIFPNIHSSKRFKHANSAEPNAKRIVIETDPENGTCVWRFVPRAKIEDGSFGNEGSWPRLVKLCGYVVGDFVYTLCPNNTNFSANSSA